MTKIKDQLDALLKKSPEEQIEFEAEMLALQFLSLVDQAMAVQGITKKELAQKIGTSASFITQLFRGDRKPNWTTLAKMKQELDLDFKVHLQSDIDQMIREHLEDYHNKWVKTKSYESYQGQEISRAVLSITDGSDYAMAG
ncbi:MAG: helix-turn-helix transcriptional regulator [Cyclobacteriaceae bacterium]